MIEEFKPPFWLKNGLLMTWYVTKKLKKIQIETLNYLEYIFLGAQKVPIFTKVAIPKNAKGTIVATYGITGDLENQYMLDILAQKSFKAGYAVVLFDWRAHGKTAELSDTLTSDGIYEGDDFVLISKSAKEKGCPAPFWFMGYSLGGQLALWGLSAAQKESNTDIGGGAVICPSLDSERSLTYLGRNLFGRFIEYLITKDLKKLARNIAERYPEAIDLKAIEKVDNIRSFDQEIIVKKLGFNTSKDYYDATNTLNILPKITLPTLIIYSKDDPLFDPNIANDLYNLCKINPFIKLFLTRYGGHVGYLSAKNNKETDCWWAWNRVLDFIESN
jgi:hypothetical protein